MKKQLLLSILFLVCFQVVLIGQDVPQSFSEVSEQAKHEISIYSGLSFPQWKYAELDMRVNNVGRAVLGTFTDGSYTYYFNKMVGANITVGYNYNSVNGGFIEDELSSNNPFITSEVSYTNWGMYYFMPGVSFRAKGDNQIKLTLNAGMLQLTEAGDLKATRFGSNSLDESKWEYQLTRNFAVKTGISMHYFILPKLSVQVRGGVLYSNIDRNGIFTQVRINTDTDEILFDDSQLSVSNIRLLTLNAALGLSYDF